MYVELKWVLFWFNWNITFNNKYLNYVMCYWQLTSQFIMHFPNLMSIDILLFVKSQLTTHSSNVLHRHQGTLGHVSTYSHELSRPLKCPDVLDRHEIALMKCLLILIWRWIQSFPTSKKSKGLKSGEHGGCTSKTVCGRVLIWMFVFLLWGWTQVWRRFVGTVCVLCYTCIRKARDVLGDGEVLGHTHYSFIEVN
jgi:hypothetical protein